MPKLEPFLLIPERPLIIVQTSLNVRAYNIYHLLCVRTSFLETSLVNRKICVSSLVEDDLLLDLFSFLERSLFFLLLPAADLPSLHGVGAVFYVHL